MSGPSMQAIEISQPGGPEVLRLAERPVPQPGAGEVLIRVQAAGVNRPDVLQRKGAYAPPAGASDCPDWKCPGPSKAATLRTPVSRSATRCARWLPAVVTQSSASRQLRSACRSRVPCHLLKRPGCLKRTSRFGATCLIARAWRLASRCWCRAARAGLVLLQSSWRRRLATPFTRPRAAMRSVKPASSSVRSARSIIEPKISYEVLKAATGGRGVDVILDMVAGDYMPREVQSLADDGRLVFIALLGGSKAQLDLNAVLRRRLTITGSTLRPRSIAFKAAIAKRLREVVWPLIESERIKPVLFRTFPLAQAAEAHRLMESSQHVGKIVLVVDADGRGAER